MVGCTDGAVVLLTPLSGQDNEGVVAPVLQAVQEFHVTEHDGEEDEAPAAGAEDIPEVKLLCDDEVGVG